MQGIYDERIAALSALHAQLELVHAEITGLKEEKEKLETTRAERTAELSAEENGIANCAENLEASYAKRHEELTATVEKDRSNLNTTREEYNRRSCIMNRDVKPRRSCRQRPARHSAEHRTGGEGVERGRYAEGRDAEPREGPSRSLVLKSLGTEG